LTAQHQHRESTINLAITNMSRSEKQYTTIVILVALTDSRFTDSYNRIAKCKNRWL